MCQALIDALDSGSVLNIYSGAVPDSVDEALTSQTLLVEIPLPYPTFGAIVAGTEEVTANLLSVISSPATSNGVATFFRACNSSGIPVLQGTVGMLDCDFNLSSTNITTGVSVRANSWKINISKNQTVC